MTTAGDLISNAMIEIGALAAGETATAANLAFGLSKLNRLAWACGIRSAATAITRAASDSRLRLAAELQHRRIRGRLRHGATGSTWSRIAT